MQTRNPILDDLSKLAAGAAGAAQAASDEAKTLFRSGADRIIADMDLASREEVAALKDSLAAALARIDSLEKQVETLQKSVKKPGSSDGKV